MRGKRTTRGLIIALATMTAIGMLGSAALAATARSAKQDVADGIRSVADAGHRRTAWTLERAARAVERGLADDLWVDEDTPANTLTFRADMSAVGALNRVARRSRAADEIRDLQAELVAVDRGLAVDRLNDAVASDGHERRIARARRLIARGDALAEDGRYRWAIGAYMLAWRAADNGMGDGGTTEPAAQPAVTVAVDVSTDGETWLASDTAPGEAIYDYTPVDFRFVVSNTGSVELTDITLTDSVFAAEVAANCAVPTLAPGESYTCTVEHRYVPAGDHVNTATVTATGGGVAVTDSNSVYLDVSAGSWF